MGIPEFFVLAILIILLVVIQAVHWIKVSQEKRRQDRIESLLLEIRDELRRKS